MTAFITQLEDVIKNLEAKAAELDAKAKNYLHVEGNNSMYLLYTNRADGVREAIKVVRGD